MDHLSRRLVRIAIALCVTLAGGTVGFYFIEHYPLFDAFYMTLTTVTTVGSGEIRPLSHVGRIFNAFSPVTAPAGSPVFEYGTRFTTPRATLCVLRGVA